ncbi:MAG TPA: patatin-like phospholipase family protein [Trueperaceae bacterium]|nr:patatin-like phospholipase family protein [Trueperaceae bacterium]
MKGSYAPLPPQAPVLAGGGGRLALVIGAGGAAAAAGVGAHRALTRAGVEVGLLVGSSSGGVVAAALALGWAPETVEAVLRRLWVPAVARGARLRAAVRLALPRLRAEPAFALVDGAALDERVRRAFGDVTFDDLQVPLVIAATDLATGERVELDSGSVAGAVRASMAVPLLFPPLEAGGRLLVDGAISDPFPVLTAVGHGARAVVALAFQSEAPATARSALGAVLRAHAAAANNLLRVAAAYQELAGAVPLLRLELDARGHAGLFDGAAVGASIALGEEAMRAEIATLERLMA